MYIQASVEEVEMDGGPIDVVPKFRDWHGPVATRALIGDRDRLGFVRC